VGDYDATSISHAPTPPPTYLFRGKTQATLVPRGLVEPGFGTTRHHAGSRGGALRPTAFQTHAHSTVLAST